MRYSAKDPAFADFKVMDDATGKEVDGVLWVDDVTMEYAVPSGDAVRFSFMSTGFYTDAVDETTHRVSRVAVNYVLREIHVNEPPHVHASGITVRELHACNECRQEPTCRRIHFCAAFKCGFGEADKP